MSKRSSLAAFALVAFVAATGPTLAAQDAYVYYSHKPGDSTSNPRLTFVASGERVDKNGPQRHLGQPPMLQVPRGSKACVEIEDANPLLYDYKLESKTIAIAAPEGYGDILNGLAGAVFGITRGAQRTQNQDARDQYANDINGIIQAGKALDGLKQASDTGEINYRAAADKKRVADSLANQADSIFAKNDSDAVIKLLRTVQQSATTSVTALYKQFTDAQHADLENCFEAKDSATHLTLKSTRKQDGATHARPIGSVAAFDIEPVNEKNYEVMPVGLVTVAVASARQFYLDNQQRVQDRPDRGGYFPSAGALASYRLGGWVWAGAAVAKGQTSTPDTFIGFVFRNPSVVRSLVLGVGAGFASVPTEISSPASLNNPLPPATELSKVIKKSTQVGLGLIFSMTGLSLSK